MPLVRQADHWLACTLVVTLAIAVAIASTTGVSLGSSWYDEQRIILTVTLCATALVARALLPTPDGKASSAVLAALALGLLSAALAARPFVAMVDWSLYCLAALLVLSARALRVSTVGAAAALVAVIVPTAYVTGVLANYASALLLGFPVGAETLLVGFSNPRFPAQLQVLTVPLLPLAIRLAPSAFWRACLVGVAALWWMCLIGSGSRTGWIALAVASLAVSFLGAEGRRWLKWQAALAATGALLWLVLFHFLPALLSIDAALEGGRLSNFESVGYRWELWRISVASALAHPLLGVGPMHFAYVDNGLGAHPHNFWLQLAAEWGVLATLLIASSALALVLGLWRALTLDTDDASRLIGVAVLAAVVAWGVGTFSDGYVVIPTSQAMSVAVLMLSVMWLRVSSGVVAASHGGRLAATVATAFCAVALAVLAILPATEFGRPTQREQVWRAEHPGQWLWPRFWQQGWIGPNEDPSARSGVFSLEFSESMLRIRGRDRSE